MKESPSRGLAPRTYLPIVVLILALAAIPIALFLHTGFATNGSAINAGPASGPPPMIASAVAELRARIARNPKDSAALQALAGLELEAGRLESAADLFAQAVQTAPHNARLRAAYAEVLNTEGKSKAAKDQLDVILQRDPHNPDAHYERGIVNERLGNHAEADQDFRQFLAHASSKDPRRAALLGRSGSSD